MVLGSLIVARLKLPFVDFQRCGFRLGVLFCRAVMKIGMTQNMSPSFTSSHSTSSGDASPTTVRLASRKVGRLRRADIAANWSDIATRKYSLSGGCCDFPDFGHKAKYAPFGMLGKPKSAVIIKGATTRLRHLRHHLLHHFHGAAAVPHTGHHLPCHRQPIWVCDVSLMRTSLKQQIRPSCGVI